MFWVLGLFMRALSKPVKVSLRSEYHFSRIQTIWITTELMHDHFHPRISSSALRHLCLKISSPEHFITHQKHIHNIFLNLRSTKHLHISPENADTSLTKFTLTIWHTQIELSHFLSIRFQIITSGLTCILSYWGYHHLRADFHSFISGFCLTCQISFY